MADFDSSSGILSSGTSFDQSTTDTASDQSGNTTQTGTQQDGQTPETASGPSETGSQGQDGQQQGGFDPELESFVRAKGLDPTKYAGDSSVQSLASSYRSIEAEASRMRNELAQLRAQQQQVAQPDANVKSQQQQSFDPNDLSPIDKLNQSYNDVVQGQLFATGCQTLQELQENFPQIAANINNWHAAEHRKALEEQVNYLYRKDESDRKKKEQELQQKDYIASVKNTAVQNLSKARKDNPKYDLDYVKSGVGPTIELISNVSGIPVEYFHADDRIMGFAAKAAKYISQIESGEYRKQVEAEVRESLKKQSAGTLPPAGAAVPADLQFVNRYRGNGGIGG
jgi:hypothetical protein